jgi:hypothetical protein
MNQQLYIEEKKSIKNLTLIMIAFASIFYPRIFDSLGLPSFINFIHFLIVPFTLGVAIVTTPVKDRRQIKISWEIIFGCCLFLAVNLASALLNKAGVINAFLEFVLLTEPYMLLIALLCLPLSEAHVSKLRSFFLISAVINLVLAVLQYWLIIAGILPVTSLSPADNVQGVFYLTGAGNYISVSISIAAALYYLIDAKNIAFGWRSFWLLASFYQLLVSDSKQILIVYVIAWIILIFTKYKYLDKLLLYFIGAVVFLIALFWAIENIDFAGLYAFKYWFSRTELYGPDGEAIRAKTEGINLMISYFKSPLNWFLGLGPGHTIGRVGGWILRDYAPLLAPLKPTVHPVTQQIWDALKSNWLVLESSMFSPIFTWAGLWGDLGFLGMGSYFYLAYIAWQRVCKDDLSKLLMLTMLVYGIIFTQVEEPGQSMTVALMLGLQWHQRQNKKRSRLTDAMLSTGFEPQLGKTNTSWYIKSNKRR